VFENNYIGRKNDTELRASRWQREITLAMHFFLFYEGEIIVRNCLHGKELLERHEAARNYLSFWIFVSLIPPLLYINLQLINNFDIKIHIQLFILISYILYIILIILLSLIK